MEVGALVVDWREDGEEVVWVVAGEVVAEMVTGILANHIWLLLVAAEIIQLRVAIVQFLAVLSTVRVVRLGVL